MKKILLLIMACLAIIIGCTDDAVQNDITSTVENDALMVEKYLEPLMNYDIAINFPEYKTNFNSKRGNAVTKPLKIRESGTTTIVYPPNNGCLDSEVFVIVEGEGQATHLGRHQMDIEFCSYDGFNSDYIVYGHMTAANGDIVYGILTEASADPEFGLYQDWEFYDGTGRFEDAIGQIRLYVDYDFDNLTWSVHGVGTLTY